MNTTILFNTPSIPDEVYSHLPPFIRTCTDQFSDRRERDVVLLSLLSMLGACLSSVRGKYARDEVAPNLFVLVVAPAGSNKGVMKYAKLLGQPLQDKLMEENRRRQEHYLHQLEEWKRSKRADKGEPPAMPPRPVLFIPGNSTSAAIYSLLHENEGRGIICETETDTLSGSIKSDWGNFSDLLRKCFHHETLSVSRKGNREYFEIKFPTPGIVLTGTPEQTVGLIPSSENGLFSRFTFYCYKNPVGWMDVTPCEECEDLNSLFLQKGEQVRLLVESLQKTLPTFQLTSEQFSRLNHFFNAKIERIKKMEGEEAASAVYRLGLISFRIAMIFSIIRSYEKGPIPNRIVCEEVDFTTTLRLAEVLFEHTMVMFGLLPKKNKKGLKAHLRAFYSGLPEDIVFTRKVANETGASLGLSLKSITNNLNDLLAEGFLEKIAHGKFRKVKQQ